MDIITTSLEALIQRATSVHNQGPDTAAIDAFCGLINKEPECTQVASKFIIAKAHSLKEWEALQALLVLENCMKKCGIWFHSEVGKFRFLNELIKLVSPKYLGAHTPDSVKRRVLELMSYWSTAFPNQSKIKEAYVMLKKQGVVQEEIVPHTVASPAITQVELKERTSSIFQDEEKSLLLQKLLRSNNPVDLQAANRLIKTMVKEDEKRVEEKWRRRVELETVVNNCLLLREMLASYENGSSSQQDIELIHELHTTCTNLRPVLIRLANNPDPSFTCDVLSANDELGEVLTRYKEVMSQGGGVRPTVQQSSLLDLTSPDRPSATTIPPTPRGVNLMEEDATSTVEPSVSSLDDILSLTPSISVATNNIPQSSHIVSRSVENTPVKPKGLKELDLLGENLLKEILSNSGQQQTSKRNSNKVSMNELLLNGTSQNGERVSSSTGNDSEGDLIVRLSPTVAGESSPLNTAITVPGNTTVPSNIPTQSDSKSESLKNDEPLLSLGEMDTTLESLVLNDTQTAVSSCQSNVTSAPNSTLSDSAKAESKDRLQETKTDDAMLLGSPSITQPKDSPHLPPPLSEVNVLLENIKPSGVAPWACLSDADGLTLVVTLASDRPRPDVSVFVVTSTSKSKQPLQNFLFQPVVPKSCRLRLLRPSATSLPAFNPFLPPAAITQIMLIASQSREPICLKFVISYVMEEETMTEMSEINQLLLTE